MITGKTETGFEFTVSDSARNDWELVEALAELDAGNNYKIGEVLTRLVGDEQKNALKEHCRNAEGIVPADVMYNEIGSIFKYIREHPQTKN